MTTVLDAMKVDTNIPQDDWQGLWQLSGHNIVLRDGIRKYFRGRNEDVI